MQFGLNAQNTSYNKDDIPINGSNNVAFGVNSLTNLTSGSANSAVGRNTLSQNSTGQSNTAIGHSSLKSNNFGVSNTTVGAASLEFPGGDYNTAIGTASQMFVSGSYNTSLGSGSLAFNSGGNYNTAVGYYATVSSSNLFNATAIGNGAIVNNSNSIQLGNSEVTEIYSGVGTNAKLITGRLQVADGSPGPGMVLTAIDALGNATWQTPSGGGGWSLTGNAGTVDGINFIGTTDNVPFNIRVNNERAGRLDPIRFNTFYGLRAGQNISGGQNNIAIGFEALRSGQNNIGDVAIGTYALRNSTGGLTNTAVGYITLMNNTNGTENSAFGAGAMNSNTGGAFNTAVGLSALFNNITGFFNVSIGHSTMHNNVNGNNNTALGYSADVSIDGLSNASAIGNQAVVNANNKVRIGDVNVTVIEGQVDWSWPSDGRFKNNINEYDVKGLDFVNRLRPVVYNFDTRKFQEFLTQNMPDSIREKYFSGKDFTKSTAIRQSGFIAQEVEIAAQQSDYNFNGLHKPESENDNYSLAYSQFVVPLVKSVQELSQQNTELKKVFEEQKSQNESLKKQIDELRAIVMNIAGDNKTGSIKFSGKPFEAKLLQNAPNPFNKSTTIRYSIPVDTKKAKIILSSLDGRNIMDFDLMSTNGQGIEISGGKLSPGTYIYSLVVEERLVDSKKMILTR